MIIQTKEQTITELKQMWQETFFDRKEFIDLFFDNFYNEENVFFAKENEKIISCLYLLPFNMKFFSSNVKTSYLCGAITEKEYRSKGEMEKLMIGAFEHLFDNGTVFCTLIPFSENLFDYYKRKGFYEGYFNKKILLKRENISLNNSITFKDSKDAKFFSEIYNKIYYKNELSLSRDEKLFEFLIGDYSIIENSRILKIYKNSIPCGYLFYRIEDGKGAITEFCYKDIDFFEFKNSVLDYFNVSELIAIAPSYFNEEGEEFKIGMVRIINLYTALSLYAKNNPQVKRVFTVKDKQIPQNNATYKISNGFVYKTNEISENTLDINEISSIIFNRKGYINLLLV